MLLAVRSDDGLRRLPLTRAIAFGIHVLARIPDLGIAVAARALITSMVGCVLGILLGVANVLVIATAMGVAEPSLEGGWVATIGMMPGVLTGAILGVVASATARAAKTIRLCALIFPALSVVWMLGVLFELERYVLLACIPTVVACILLERATRFRTPLPDARVVP